MKQLLFFAFMLAVSSLSTAQKQINMIIHPDQVDCQRMMKQKCYQVRINGSKEWTLFYDRIEGFNFEPGFRYELSVIKTKRPEPIPQDLSAYTYKLAKVISKTAVVSNTQLSNWKIVSINGKSAQSTNLFIQFDPNKNGISGFAGCNRFFGEAKWNATTSKLIVGELASTKMYCENTMAIEDKIMKLLANQSFQVISKNERIYLKQKRKTVFVLDKQLSEEIIKETDEEIMEPLINEKQISPMDNFNNKNLKLIQINQQTLTSASTATIRFDSAAHSFSGFAGCNRIFGNFSFANNVITIESVNATKMACMDETTAQLEKTFIANLNTHTFQVDYAENVLNCYNSNGELIMMFAIQK